jgi:mannose-6-phosphate isomerase-like protein (cupin superfamily)
MLAEMRPRFDLESTFVNLGRDGSTVPLEVTESFWQDLASGKLGAGPGRLLSLFSLEGAWEVWEVHPNGDEVVLLLEGAAEMTLERTGGNEVVRLDSPGSFVLIERGTWHTARSAGPTRLLFITDGEGTEHRPA